MNNPFARALSAALSLAIVSRQVSDQGELIGFLYHEQADFLNDSGWRLFSGQESDEYANNPDNFQVLPLSEILDENPEIAPLMQQSFGAWEWNDNTEQFTAVSDWQPKE
ncbi:DUF2185 domain-containing protein [Kingella kingae]|uniref:DUF2185 domain-containing protein n=1 Tax=Kingella kingae TaxID=504 RepID=UPI0003FF7B38|nr:DUF2185 domain-containing protein [Kingella kingae]MDK4575630.1 DUF2185 domain-containing protein [Kingella kingae]MDK4581569.1 DUF2185 domain-containing protein [Kingella kingae]MDK4591818.1 DUF2185 domain-containing protein [Kingella kingae]MDK4593915.1 DUF2185 domain-containing protein [Kingella kingae]MDK4645701.1 DUF2185 domain-containing protein [Kingella kingae]